MKVLVLICWIALSPCIWSDAVAETFHYQTDFPRILAETKEAHGKNSYDSLVVRFLQMDSTIVDSNVLALMIGFTLQPEYHPYTDVLTEDSLYSMNDKGRFEETIERGTLFIRDHPVNQRAWLELSYAFHQSGKQNRTDYCMFQFHRILQTMKTTGEGTSPQSPIFALGPMDGQNFVTKLIRAKISSMGSGFDSDKNFLDIIHATLRDGTEKTYYFIIQHAENEIMDQLKEAKQK